MRPVFLALTLLAVLPLVAGEVLIAHPSTPVGAPQLQPWNTLLYRNPAMATDGQEVVVVWTGHRHNTGGTIYAMRLDRNGKPLSKLPVVLVEGRETSGVELNGAAIRVVWTDGLYAIFYLNTRGRLSALRVTRELEIVESRVFETRISQHFDVARSGDEIFVAGAVVVLRLGLDLTVLEHHSFPYPEHPWTQRSVADSPRGAVVLAGRTPALTGRYFDSKAGEVRIGSVTDWHESSDIEWTGSEFVVVWMDCSSYSSCHVQTARLDADLRLIASKTLANVYCHVCSDGVGITLLGTDEVLLTWQSEDNTFGQRFRKGVALDAQPLNLPSQLVAMSWQGKLLAVDGKMRVGVIPPPGDASAFSPQTAIELARQQWPIAVGRSNREIAVAWNAGWSSGATATVLTLDGAPVRTVPLQESGTGSIASDGHDLYALTRGTWYTHFQKLTAGSEAVRVDLVPLFTWIGTGFLVVRPKRYDYDQEIEIPASFAVLTRAGKLRDVCTQAHEVPVGIEAIVPAGTHTLLVGQGLLARVRGGCPGPVEQQPLIRWEPRVAWREGRLASLFPDQSFVLNIATASDGGRLLANPRPLFDGLSQHSMAAIAGVRDGWLVLNKVGGTHQADELHALLLDDDGNVLFRTVIDESVVSRPYLVAVSETEAVVAYSRLEFSAPWLGEARVVARRLTIAEATKRRTVRH